MSKSKAQVFGARLFSTLLMWALVTGVFLSGSPWAFVAMTSVLAIAASVEFFRMTKEGDLPCQRRWGLTISIVYTLVVAAVLASKGKDGFGLLSVVDGMAISLAVIGTFIIQLREPIEGKKPLISVASTVLGFLYVPFLFSFMPRLLFVPDATEVAVPGAWLLLWMVAVTKFTDMGAYITGSLIGKHKMIPHVSPGKTWQGFFGALVFAQLAACGLVVLIPDLLGVLGGWGHVIGLGLLLALLAVVGDLAESIVKRSLEVKDSGKTLPGIGGALDLIDSLCFTAPALYFYLHWIV